MASPATCPGWQMEPSRTLYASESPYVIYYIYLDTVYPYLIYCIPLPSLLYTLYIVYCATVQHLQLSLAVWLHETTCSYSFSMTNALINTLDYVTSCV